MINKNDIHKNSFDKALIINTEELFSNLNNPLIKIIDIRPIEAYNGWKLHKEKRGGHIPNATSIPLKWASYIDWVEIIKSKEIRPDQQIILYSYDIKNSEQVMQRFQKLGYEKIKIYNNFIDEWSANEKFPLEKLEKYAQLVSADWLNQLINTGTADEFYNDRYVICHAHYQNPEDYNSGHIPTAIAIDTNTLESPETWNRRSPEEIKNSLENLGITCYTTVILYGRFSFPSYDNPFPGSSAGHLGAMRCAFIMLYAGVKDIRILNGGVQSWLDAGYELTKEVFLPKPVTDFGTKIPAHPELAVDIHEAKEILKSNQANLVCVRSYREYIGEVSGYHYIKKKGHIPGCVFAICGSDAYHMENYRNLDHTIKEAQEVIKQWKEVGITPDKHNSFYCGTGWRGSEAFINAWLMGWTKISVFDGGWFEWSNDELNPIEIGDPTKK